MTLAFVKIFLVAFCLPSVEPSSRERFTRHVWSTSPPARDHVSPEPPLKYQEKGQKGEIDHKGNQDLIGPKGNKGLPGLPGAPGVKGDKGERGLTGARGPQGAPGVIGPQGFQGANGQQGPPGNTGFEGPEGPPGPTGPRGPPGQMGSKGIQGIKGARGSPGLAGHHGNPGPNGHKGREGERGEKGIKGDTGRTGHQGEQGRQGIPGTMIDEEYLETYLEIYYKRDLEAYLTNMMDARFAQLTQSLNNRPAAHLYGRGFNGYRLTWTTGGYGGFVNNGMRYEDGYLFVPKRGLYYIYAQVKCDPKPPKNWCGFAFRINNSDISQQFISQDPRAEDVLYYNVPEAGLLRKLKKGDRISVNKRGPSQIFGQDRQTYFGCYAISTFDS